MTDYYEWLKNLEPGDKVILESHYSKNIETVERTTKTQIILKGIKIKFRKSSGYQIGGDIWSKMSIHEATPKKIKKIQDNIEKTKLRKKIKELFPKIDSLDKLKQILKVMEIEK